MEPPRGGRARISGRFLGIRGDLPPPGYFFYGVYFNFRFLIKTTRGLWIPFDIDFGAEFHRTTHARLFIIAVG